MSTPPTDQSAILHVPARIYVGGNLLGLTKNVGLVVKKPTTDIMEEGLGSKIPIAVLGLGEVWSIVCVVRAPDQGQASTFFQTGEAGSVTGDTGIVYPGNPTGSAVVLPGQYVSGVTVKLLPVDSRQWGVYFPNAVPIALDSEIAHSMAREGGFPVAFKAMPPISGANGETAQWRPQEDIVT